MRFLTLHAIILSIFCFSGQPLSGAQHAVPVNVRYHRIICVVPVVGTGKVEDPIRLQYAPVGLTHTRNTIFTYSYQLSDDKKSAIVEYVAADRAAFAEILADKNPNTRVFERGRDSRKAIEAELRKWKKDIDLDHFGVAAR